MIGNILLEAMENRYYTSKDLMRIFNVSSFTLFRYLNSNRLPDFPKSITFTDRKGKNAKRYWEKVKVDNWVRENTPL